MFVPLIFLLRFLCLTVNWTSLSIEPKIYVLKEVLGTKFHYLFLNQFEKRKVPQKLKLIIYEFPNELLLSASTNVGTVVQEYKQQLGRRFIFETDTAFSNAESRPLNRNVIVDTHIELEPTVPFRLEFSYYSLHRADSDIAKVVFVHEGYNKIVPEQVAPTQESVLLELFAKIEQQKNTTVEGSDKTQKHKINILLSALVFVVVFAAVAIGICFYVKFWKVII